MANPIKIYKTLEEAYNALLKGFRSVKNRDPDIIENQMLKAEAEGKIKSQGDNISIFPQDKPEGIMSQAPGTKKPDLDRPFVTEDEMSAFTMEENARKLNKAKGFIDEVGAKTTNQKLFVADLIEDLGQDIFKNVDMGATFRSNMYDDLIDLGIDEDTVMDIMYSNTKSNDFGISMAKIKSNAVDKGVKPEEIAEVADFYERVFYQVNRPKKADGGRIGYAVGSLPKGIQKLVQALNKKFGKYTVKTADEMDRPKNVQEFEDFETRNPNVESSEDIIDADEVRKIAPKLVERFELKQRFPGIDDELLTNIIEDPDPQHKAEVIATLEETFKMMQTGKGTDEIIDILEQGKKTRKDNAQGGLNYLMGL